MSNPNTKPRKSNIRSKAPNKESAIERAEPPKKPTTQAEFYKYAHAQVFNKLSKEAQATLLINLKRPPEIIRGQERFSPDVTNFTKQVMELGEFLYDRFTKQAKAKTKAR